MSASGRWSTTWHKTRACVDEIKSGLNALLA